jgi:hypothetical protein
MPAFVNLVLLGDVDLLLGRNAGVNLVRRIPHARLERIRCAGHDLAFEAPMASAETTAAFLAADAPLRPP